MISLLTGENSFELRREVESIVGTFSGTVERVDGSELELRQLPELVMGGTLFSDKRLIVVRQLSDNKTIWPQFADWLPRVSDDVHLVMIEPKPDKRTKTYKELQKVASVKDFAIWTDRDGARAESWVIEEAGRMSFKLDMNSSRELVRRIGVDQWGLFHALEKLSVLDEVTPARVQDVIEARPQENVFLLFEAALKGDTRRVHSMIGTLSLSEDPYMLFGLLSGQAFQLAILASTDKSSAQVAKDLGVHPYALGKLKTYASQLGKAGSKKVLQAFVKADDGIKLSRAEPWLLVEQALLTVAS